MRKKMPDRRPSITRVLDTASGHYYITLGIDPNDEETREVFIRGSKIGSDMDLLLDDASLILSLALQHGLPLDQLMHSLNTGRAEHGKSVLASAIKIMSEEMSEIHENI
jgi:hypothetical protein|tara:strand:+ start:1097 stop:1423 length:327 start_codon:yes stop_codon:yes gene_type:complete